MTRRRSSRSRSRGSSRTWPPARSTARCRASTSSRQQEQREYGPGNYMPNVRVIYWSMRVMAYAGVLMFLVAALGAWLYWKQEARAGALVPLDGDRGDRAPLHRGDRGLDPDRDGAPALDRAGPAEDGRRELAERQHDVARDQPRVLHHPLRRAARRRHLAHAPLRAPRRVADECRGRARRRPRRRWATDGSRRSSGSSIVAFFWSGYFLLEGFDFGVGMLLPFLPRDEASEA